MAATADDLPRIKELLTNSQLPTDGVDEHWRTFVVARNGSRIVGCGGSEAYQFAALIPSISVEDEYRRHRIGRRLVRQLLHRLASRRPAAIYPLTPAPQTYFR